MSEQESQYIHDLDLPVEGRDWIGNPDGTLVYKQAEGKAARARAEAAEARIAAVLALCDEKEQTWRNGWDTDDWPRLDVTDVRAALGVPTGLQP